MNISLFSLWLPILLGTVLAWIASMLVHMVLKYHDRDYQKFGNEEAVMDAIRDGSPEKGFYGFPRIVDMADYKDEAVLARFAKGPVGFAIIAGNGMPNMGKLVGQQVAFFLLGIVLVAYVASLALQPGASYFEVFRLVMTVAFLAFSWASVPYSIWFGIPRALFPRRGDLFGRRRRLLRRVLARCLTRGPLSAGAAGHRGLPGGAGRTHRRPAP